ncbi:MAG TPA: outer membrane beta-barrel protein [Vicinamibacteria bacterium]|nr:outer membrane beta-barrel protein [Vicinamibacteria bacterium]
MAPGRLVAAAVLALALIASAAPAAAQDSRLQFGAHLNVSDDADLGLGAGVRWPFLRDDRRLALVASFDYYFPEDEEFDLPDEFRDLLELFGGELPFDFEQEVDREYWEANLNLTWDFSGSGTVIPYAGVGVTYGRAKVSAFGVEEDESDVGANVLAGARIARRFFVEAKREAGGGDLFVVTAGVRF